jgi:tetratricopeptide (TPR) repeat protein
MRLCLRKAFLYGFIISGLFGLVSAAFGAGPEKDANALFLQANQDYKNGRFDEAASGYEKLVGLGAGTGDILYNIGNCNLRQNRLGEAVLYYERAKILMPRDPDLDFNLRFAEDKRLDHTEEESSLLGWLSYFSLAELFWAFAAVHVMFCLAVTIRMRRRAEWNYYVVIALFILWGMSGFFCAARWQGTAYDDRAVVTAPEAEVRAGPDEKETLLFSLHAGTIVKNEREEGNWRLVTLPPEKRGWAEKAAITPIRRTAS